MQFLSLAGFSCNKNVFFRLTFILFFSAFSWPLVRLTWFGISLLQFHDFSCTKVVIGICWPIAAIPSGLCCRMKVKGGAGHCFHLLGLILTLDSILALQETIAGG